MEDADENEQPPLIFDNGDHFFFRKDTILMFSIQERVLSSVVSRVKKPQGLFFHV